MTPLNSEKISLVREGNSKLQNPDSILEQLQKIRKQHSKSEWRMSLAITAEAKAVGLQRKLTLKGGAEHDLPQLPRWEHVVVATHS